MHFTMNRRLSHNLIHLSQCLTIHFCNQWSACNFPCWGVKNHLHTLIVFNEVGEISFCQSNHILVIDEFWWRQHRAIDRAGSANISDGWVIRRRFVAWARGMPGLVRLWCRIDLVLMANYCNIFEREVWRLRFCSGEELKV